MDDFKNEERIATFDSNRLVLTNRRIIYRSNQDYKSIRLENITYMELTKRSMTRILYGAVIINILLPIFFAKDDDGLEDAFKTAGIILACAFVAYYFIKRRSLMFATSGGAIRIDAGHMTYEECYRFIEFAENAVNVLKSNNANPVLNH